MNHYHVVIIGAGQAALPLARKLAGKGRSVAIAERKHLGGSCVNFGCTPTKAVVASARVAHLARRAGEFGILVPAVRADWRLKGESWSLPVLHSWTPVRTSPGYVMGSTSIRHSARRCRAPWRP